jgi:hypothetical protein
VVISFIFALTIQSLLCNLLLRVVKVIAGAWCPVVKVSFQVAHELELKIDEECNGLNNARRAKHDHGVVQRLHVLVVAGAVVGDSDAVVVIESHGVHEYKTAEREDHAEEFHGRSERNK